MQQQRVFMIGWEYPPHNSGGLGVACQGLTEALALQGEKIHFSLPFDAKITAPHMDIHVCRHPSWDISSELDSGGSFVANNASAPPFFAYGQEYVAAPFDNQAVPTGSSPYDFDITTLRKSSTSKLEKQVTQYAQAVLETSTSLGNSFDVIHAHDWMSFPAALELKKKTKKPIITHVHSTEYDRAGLQQGNAYITHVERQGMQLADQIIAVSYYTKRILENVYNIDPAKISVVHNGVIPLSKTDALKNVRFANKRPVIVFMGRLTVQKGVHHFLQLASSVLRSLPEALFILAGDGDMYHELLFHTAHKGLSANVLFSGFVRDQQRNRLLERADVFVMPSLSEPFGLVALEAAQYNTPVIISKNAGASEVLPHAIALDFWDIEAMSHSVVNLVRNQQYAATIAKQQQEDLARQTWQSSAQKVARVYAKAFLG